MENKLNTRNKKGEGSIALRPNGTYYGRITLEGLPKKTFYGKTEKEVRAKMNAYKEQAIRGEAFVKKIIVSDYIEEWLINYKQPSLKPASYDRLEVTFKEHIKDSYVGRCQLGSIRSTDIQKLINSKTDTLSYSSIKKIYQLLNACFRYAVTSRDLSFNPMDGVLMPKEAVLAKKTKEVPTLTPAELEKLYEASKLTYSTGNIRFRYGYAYILIANTGLRCGEALALTWDCVDFTTNTIRINKSVERTKNRSGKSENKTLRIIGETKTKNSNRTIPLNARAKEAMLFYKALQKKEGLQTDYVIATNTGQIVQNGAFQNMLNNMLKQLGIAHIGIHSLRHTFATNLIHSGVDVKVVSKLLGHASVSITYNTYVHTTMDDAILAVQALEKCS